MRSSSLIGPVVGWLGTTALIAGGIWFLMSGDDGTGDDLGSWSPYPSYDVASPDTVAGAVALGPLPVGGSPLEIVADSTGFAYLTRAGDTAVTRIEPVTGATLRIEVGGRPEGIDSDGNSLVLRNGTGSLVEIGLHDAEPSATPLGFEPVLVGTHDSRPAVIGPGAPVLHPTARYSDTPQDIPLAGVPKQIDGDVLGTSVLLDGSVETLAGNESAGTQPVPAGTTGLTSTSRARYVWGPGYVGLLAPPGTPQVDPILPLAGVESVAADSEGVWIATRDGRLRRWSSDLKVSLGRVDGVGRRAVLASTADRAVWVLDRETATVRLVRPRVDLGRRPVVSPAPAGAPAGRPAPAPGPAPRPTG